MQQCIQLTGTNCPFGLIMIQKKLGKLGKVFSFGLVVIARVKHQIPFRTPWLSTVAPIVLRLKAWESRSLPNLKKTCFVALTIQGTRD